MKKYLFIIFLFTASFCSAQTEQNADTLHQTAKTFLRQGDYENAVLVLTKALQMQPNDLQITKDLLFAYYLREILLKPWR
jgi:Flp pilus assembly protein TadD